MSRTDESGFTLVELAVSVVIFALITVGVLSAYSALTKAVKGAREKAVLASLASNYMEIVKNLPYSQVGTVSGNPTGVLPDFSNATTTVAESVTYKIYYEVTYIDDPADGTAPTDTAAADYKQVKMSIQNLTTGAVTNFVANIVPKGLEGTVGAGALLVKVFDSTGQPVAGANVHIQRPTTSPTLVLDRLSDATGQWLEVGLATGTNAYRVVVTKAGYSTDQTYWASSTNPNPTKPDVTIVAGQVTQVSFFIDQLSNLTLKTVNSLCQPINGVNLNVRGAKLIGTSPDVYKFNQNFTTGPATYPPGEAVMSDIEWDTYTPTLLTGQSYVVRGTSPIQKIDVLPGTSQTFTMVLDTVTTPNSLLVIVKNAATGAAIEGAYVQLQKGGSQPPPFGQGAVEQSYDGYTSGSVWEQIDWTGGPGVPQWSATSTDRYYADNGNVDINSVPTGIRLKKVTGDYLTPGELESSTFDTGSASTSYTTLSWEPTSQDPAATLQFQIASSDENTATTTWTYLGPDGTAGTYYAVPGTSMWAGHNGKRYVRYKAYLSTTNTKKTPVLTSTNINFVSGCFTPGQLFFKDLTAGNNYHVGVTAAGYQTQVINDLTITAHQTLEVLMSP